MNETIDHPLTKALADKVKSLCQLGYSEYDKNNYKLAIRHFFEAWNLLPKPQSQWIEAGWVLTALGDSYFKAENYNSAIEALKSALHCPNTDTNPFVHMRLGQCLYQQQLLTEAKLYLQDCLNHGGNDLLAKEPSCYLALLNDDTDG